MPESLDSDLVHTYRVAYATAIITALPCLSEPAEQFERALRPISLEAGFIEMEQLRCRTRAKAFSKACPTLSERK